MINRMSKRARERFHFEVLSKAVADFPMGSVSQPDPPAPDFVVDTGSARIGIELTTYHLPPPPGERPHQEQQSLKDRIVYLAEQMHCDAGGPALYVSVYFHLHSPLSKKDTQSLAQKIATSVLNSDVPRSIREPVVELPFGVRPAQTAAIVIRGSVDGEDKLWNADAGGWVAQLTSKDVEQAIRAKARREPAARKHCDQLWLVIVNDDASLAAPAEISDEALKAAYDTRYDRLIWLLPHSPRAFDLECQRIGSPITKNSGV
jgi:hypothetical protein